MKNATFFIYDRPVMYQINIGGNFEETSKDITHLIMSNIDVIVVIIFNKSSMCHRERNFLFALNITMVKLVLR